MVAVGKNVLWHFIRVLKMITIKIMYKDQLTCSNLSKIIAKATKGNRRHLNKSDPAPHIYTVCMQTIYIYGIYIYICVNL